MRATVLALLLLAAARGLAAPLVDHHQHLFSPAAAARSAGVPRVEAADLVRMLDAAGIGRAVVLSTAYQLGNPNRAVVPDEYQRVKEENDWTAAQVALYPDRLVGFCSFNPLRDYALAELNRCAGIPELAAGIKLHFGNSDVDLDNPAHVSAVRRIFAAANARHMAIVVHLHPSVTLRRPFGAAQARVFLDQVLPAAAAIPVQIAHLCGAGGYDPQSDAALGVFAAAAARRDSRLRNVYFDVSGVAGVGDSRGYAPTIARRLRALGLRRILYGSDGAVDAESTPARRAAALRELPLTAAEMRTLESNVAPYLRARQRPAPARANAPLTDHHQHLLAPAMTAPGQQPITGAALIAALDAAGIRRAVILSNAYRIGSPLNAIGYSDEYARVIAENDWTARQAAMYPSRLVAFCSFNPLKEYALTELTRCARDRRFGRGIKLQFGNSGVDLGDPTDVAILRRLFRAANANHMAIVVHLRHSESRIFLEDLLPQAPDIVVQIAHLGGGGGGELDTTAEEALAVFATAFTQSDPRVRNLWFDVSGITGGANSAARAPRIAQLLRSIGTQHLLYGSDGGDPTDPPPRAALEAFRRLPLSPSELRAIEGNVAPYLAR